MRWVHRLLILASSYAQGGPREVRIGLLRGGIGGGKKADGGPTCQAVRQWLQRRCPQGWILTSLSLSVQILQSSNVEFMAS